VGSDIAMLAHSLIDNDIFTDSLFPANPLYPTFDQRRPEVTKRPNFPHKRTKAEHQAAW
jgi:hypothetical protein